MVDALGSREVALCRISGWLVELLEMERGPCGDRPLVTELGRTCTFTVSGTWHDDDGIASMA
jgi:hypothetical protein